MNRRRLYLFLAACAGPAAAAFAVSPVSVESILFSVVFVIALLLAIDNSREVK
jgi:hypothetical protein